jgi:hypothetical protein
MATYDDDAVTLDETGITVKNYSLPGRPRTIRYNDIVQAEIIDLGFGTGRHQLVGIGPLRPRLFFHWDRKRATKSRGISLDLGRRLRLAITPDEPDRVLAHIRSHTLNLDVDR